MTRLRNGTLSYQDILRLEIPYSRDMVEAFWLAAGGTMLAARQALATAWGSMSAAAFTMPFRTMAKASAPSTTSPSRCGALQHEGAIERAMVVDCDVHHGNGTAAILPGDDSVFTLSIHQFNNYPAEKPPSSLDIHLADGIGDAEYLHRLGNGYRAALAMFKPELVLYVAGADPYRGGPARRVIANLRRLERARPNGDLDGADAPAPVAIVLAGGYAQSVEDTVTIHANTAEVAKEVLGKVGYRRRVTGG